MRGKSNRPYAENVACNLRRAKEEILAGTWRAQAVRPEHWDRSMHGKSIKPYVEHVAYNLRRAKEERRKAEAAPSESVRIGRLELAAMFEARAEAMPTLH
jgi:hypothetical protein